MNLEMENVKKNIIGPALNLRYKSLWSDLRGNPTQKIFNEIYIETETKYTMSVSPHLHGSRNDLMKYFDK